MMFKFYFEGPYRVRTRVATYSASDLHVLSEDNKTIGYIIGGSKGRAFIPYHAVLGIEQDTIKESVKT